MIRNEIDGEQCNGAVLHNTVQSDPRAEYDSARKQLERLMAAPVKDFSAIDDLVDRLERLQLSLKAAHGIKGNNPNE